jgi:alpha-galactosidase
MNQTNINVQLLTIAAAREQSMEHVYHAALLDPHTVSQLSTDEIISLCDELRAAHESAGYPIF